jgi:excisionase family DNA binding protein
MNDSERMVMIMKPEISGLSQFKPLAVTIPDASRLTGIGRTVLYEHIKAKRLPILKSGRRTLVRVDALEALLRSLEVPDAS